MSVLVELGKIAAPVCAVRYPKRGKELPASYSVLRHMAKREGKGLFDLVLFDGLYACEPLWKLCDEIGVSGLVKTSEESLNIIKDANGIFDAPRLLPEVEYVEELDLERSCSCRIWAVGELEWSNIERKLKVARVEQTFLKGARKGQKERFWVLTQDSTLDGSTLKLLAHRRWFIENNLFKAFNEQTHSKHLFNHTPAAAVNITLLQMVGRTCLEFYRTSLERSRQCIKDWWDHGTFSPKVLRTLLRSSLGQVELNTT